MKTKCALGFALLLATGCSAAKMAASPGYAGRGEAAAERSVAPTAAVDAADSPSEAPAPGKAVIAGEPKQKLPAAGQLTAGVWDDNLNFPFFKPYAARMGQSSRDLGVFAAAEQEKAAAAARRPHRELDVELVIDTTGSMGDELRYLQSELDTIAGAVRAKFPDLVPRWSLVIYRDHSDAYVTEHVGFTTDTAAFRDELRKASAGGGGDFPEAVVEALRDGLQQSWRSDPDTAKVMFWVADAPPHPGEGGAFADVVREARDMSVHIYPIASSGIDDATEYQMRAAAQLTGGRYLFLTNDSGIGNSHAEPHIPCYSVTRLDTALARMIQMELTGDRAEPAAEDVVRRVGNPDASGKCSAGGQMVVAI